MSIEVELKLKIRRWKNKGSTGTMLVRRQQAKE